MIFLTFTVLLIFAAGVAEGDENLALYGRATHSSNAGWLSTAYNAIDGNTDSLYLHGSCFSTQFELSPWFRVDLFKTHTISKIMITNRGDCCAEFINGAEILIGDSLANNGNNNPRCTVISSIGLGGTATFYCSSMKGRYVNIGLPGKLGFLTFCEVQIFGSP